MVQMLLAEGCCVTAYDPAAMKRAEAEVPPSVSMRYATSVNDAVTDADAVLILTDWPEFAKLDLAKLSSALRYPIIIDGRNLYDPAVMQENGFTYLSIGRPPAAPAREALNV